MVLVRADHAAEAEPLLTEAVDVGTRITGATSWEVAEARMVLGLCRSDLENFSGAEEQLQAAIKIFKQRPGPKHPRRVKALEELERFYDSWNELEKARAKQSVSAPASGERRERAGVCSEMRSRLR
jgi:hypothetical protein